MLKNTEGRYLMSTALKQKDNRIKVKQYITDKKGHKVAAVIDMEELNRLKTKDNAGTYSIFRKMAL